MTCFTHGPTIPYAKSRVLHTTLEKMELRFIPPLASHSTERRHRPQKCLWSHIRRSMEWQNPTFLMKKWSPRMWNGLFYSRQVNPVCKTPCFTHCPDQIGVPVCKNPTFTHSKLAPCVKRPILLTGWYNWFQLTRFYPQNRGFLWTKCVLSGFCPQNRGYLWTKLVVEE